MGLKIAIVAEYYYPILGGISEHVHFFSRELARLGHHPTIITSNVPGSAGVLPPEGVQIVRIGRGIPYFNNGSFARITWGRRLVGRLRELFDTERFDIVHIHSPTIPMLPVLAQVASRSITVGTVHTNFKSDFKSNLFYRIFRGLIQRYFENLDGRIAVSPLCVDSLQQYFDVDFRIIPNGVDIDFFSSGKRIERFDDGKMNVLFLGRFDPRNGLDCLIRAFHLVHRRHPASRLIIVGDGPLRPYYEMLVDRDVRDAVHFVGEVRGERPDYYATCDAFCFPVQRAAFSVTMLEAMASNRPLIVSDLKETELLLTRDREALFVDPFSDIAMADAICRLIDNKEMGRKMAMLARQRVERYSWRNITEQVLVYYEELLRRQGPLAIPLRASKTSVTNAATAL